ncbi:putative 2-acylglycerol O-acyltransferase [Helianthus annuus]|nr:putative 2-acylglycerol O-acyltransferase [Helianthus annuus]
MLKVEELTGELQEILNANMDDVKQRRRAREAFKDIQLTVDHVLFKSYEVNSKGVEIFSKSWLPETGSPKAVICFCHGYGDTCTYFFEGIARKFASSGYGVLAMDFPGFGLRKVFMVARSSKILVGESMGGAVPIKMHLKQPEFWNGAVLVAPMCKVVAKVLPKYKLVPAKGSRRYGVQRPEKEASAMELLNTTQDIENQLEKISLPLLILHGKADIVTDPSVSKTLYEKAKSSDKKLNLYDGCCHALLEGETDDIILSVFNDIISWLDKHSAAK